MNKSDDPQNVTLVIHNSFVVAETGVSGVVRIDDTPVAYTESIIRGHAAHASAGPDGITHGFKGPPSQGEDGTLKACEHLIEAMNRAGATWKRPTLAKNEADDADAVAHRLDGAKGELRIQVVRARNDPSFWEQAHRANESVAHGSSDELADELRAPIERKAKKIPPKQRPHLVLALNAMDTAGYTMGDVAGVFQKNHGEWAKAWGFQEIWLVGPNAHLTYRLA